MRTIHTRPNVSNRPTSVRGSLTESVVATAAVIAGLIVVSYPVAAAVTGGFGLVLWYSTARLVRTVRTVELSTTAPQGGTATSQTQQ